MKFDSRLWDGSDPLYAPGLSWSKPTNARWKAPKRYVDAGYQINSAPLPGHKGDGMDAERAAQCREYTQAMVTWWKAMPAPVAKQGQWGDLLDRYLNDKFSPIQRVKSNTRKTYSDQVAKINMWLGKMEILDLTYELAMEHKMALEAEGRTASYVTRLFKQLRAVASYGRTLRIDGAREVCETLAGIKLSTPVARSIYPTREEVMAIVDEADRRGMKSFACGYLMCFELSLRAVDIRGQWLKSDAAGGITNNGMMWQDGLTWAMVDQDMGSLSKVISKTAKSMPEAYTFDLTLLPEVQSRLRDLRGLLAAGPVIVSERTWLPYTTVSWSKTFAKLRDDLGLRRELTAMDVRAGAMTEARSVVQDPLLLRDAGQHTQISTTNGYLRDRSGGANQVVQMRGAKR